MVAYQLVDLVGRASAASILGITVRELDKLVSIYEVAERFTGLKNPGSAITWAREFMGISAKLRTPSVTDAIVDKVNRNRVTNSKDLRQLRKILRDPVAKEHFLTSDADIDTALLRVAPLPRKSTQGKDLPSDLDSVPRAMKNIPWTVLEDLKGDPEILKKIDDAEALLKHLHNTLSN